MKVLFLFLGWSLAGLTQKKGFIKRGPSVTTTGPGPNWNKIPQPNSVEDQSIYDVNKDLNIRDGDIMREVDQGSTRSTLNDEFYRWKLPIPIALSSQANRKTRGEYAEAQKEYELRTCVEFKDWEGESDYISIYPMSGCWSYVGHVYPNQQNISIQQPGCDWSATIEHELMHALGIYHEQSRPDRDDYVFIDAEEVTDGHLHNFNKYDFQYVSPVGTEYAYDSIMHYGPYSFNKNPDKPTIVPRIGYFLDVIGQRKTFSTLDAKRINALYNCADPIRKTFNCNFNLMNICGFVNQVEPEGVVYAKWSQYDVDREESIGGSFSTNLPSNLPSVDASAHVTDSGRYIFIDGNGALISRAIDHTHSESQCFSIWTYFGGKGKLIVELWEVEPDYGELEKKHGEMVISRESEDTKWRFFNDNLELSGVMKDKIYKIRLVSETDTFIAVDDLSIQEVECRHNTFFIDDYPGKLSQAQIAIQAAQEIDPDVNVLNLEENRYWSPIMQTKTGHYFQVLVNFVGTYSHPSNQADYSSYSSAFLYMVDPENEDISDKFWPWTDQFFKLFVRDQNPNVNERMDRHTSVVSEFDAENPNVWGQPTVDTPTGGFGRHSFISHFDLFTNQHGYFTKHGNLIFQVDTQDMRAVSFESLLDDCEPCYGAKSGERVCRIEPASGKSFCGCSDPMILKDNECECPPGYIYDDSKDLRLRCQDVCDLGFCPDDQICRQTDNGAICEENNFNQCDECDSILFDCLSNCGSDSACVSNCNRDYVDCSENCQMFGL